MLRKTWCISCAQVFQSLEGMVEFSFTGWFMGLGLVFGIGLVAGNRLLMVVQYLCTVVVHKHSTFCDRFAFLFAS